MQIVDVAIDRSKSHNEIVHLDPRGTGISVEDVCAALALECEGDVVNGEHEFWGQDCDGTEWRVHVAVRP